MNAEESVVINLLPLSGEGGGGSSSSSSSSLANNTCLNQLKERLLRFHTILVFIATLQVRDFVGLLHLDKPACSQGDYEIFRRLRSIDEGKGLKM